MSLPTSIQPCASGRHGQHVVTLVDELTAFCSPACEAMQYGHGRECRHIRAARAPRVPALVKRQPAPLDLDREFAALEFESAYAEASR